MKEKLKQLNKAIQLQIKRELWKEAKQLVKLATEAQVDELLGLHAADNCNIFCLCLDGIKYELWKSGRVKKTQFPRFGQPFINHELAGLPKKKKKIKKKK